MICKLFVDDAGEITDPESGSVVCCLQADGMHAEGGDYRMPYTCKSLLVMS